MGELANLANNSNFLLLVVLWTLPWKGLALWKAARRGEQKWFIALLVLNTLAILEILYIFVFSKKKASGDLVVAVPQTGETAETSKVDERIFQK